MGENLAVAEVEEGAIGDGLLSGEAGEGCGWRVLGFKGNAVGEVDLVGVARCDVVADALDLGLVCGVRDFECYGFEIDSGFGRLICG